MGGVCFGDWFAVCAFERDDVALWGLGNSFSVICVIGLHFDAFLP